MIFYIIYIIYDISYDEAYNETFHQKLGSIQCNACLAPPGATKGLSREKLYHELGLESLERRLWYRKLCSFYKIFKKNKPVYLFNPIPSKNTIPEIQVKYVSVFKKCLFKFIRPSPNSVFNCHNCKGIKYLTRLRLGLSHLREHKFKHSFQDTLNRFCSCGLHVETNTHLFLHCPLFTNQRRTLLSTVNDIDSSLTNTNDFILTYILIYGKATLDTSANTLLSNATMNYIILTNIFKESLF